MTVPRFWREIPERYNLQASRCGNCQATYFPPREVCPKCRRASLDKMELGDLSGRGTVLEWTRIHKAAPGYELQVPYVVALVATAEGPLVLGQLVDCDASELKAGTAVQAVFRRLGQDGDSGVIHYGTKWQLVRTPTAEPPAAPEPSAKKGLLRRKPKPAT